MPEERSGKKVVIIGLAKPLNEMLEKKKNVRPAVKEISINKREVFQQKHVRNKRW